MASIKEWCITNGVAVLTAEASTGTGAEKKVQSYEYPDFLSLVGKVSDTEMLSTILGFMETDPDYCVDPRHSKEDQTPTVRLAYGLQRLVNNDFKNRTRSAMQDSTGAIDYESPEWLAAEEVADKMGLDAETIYKMVVRKKKAAARK